MQLTRGMADIPRLICDQVWPVRGYEPCKHCSARCAASRQAHLMEGASIVRAVCQLQQPLAMPQAMHTLARIDVAVAEVREAWPMEQATVELADEGCMASLRGDAKPVWPIVLPLHASQDTCLHADCKTTCLLVDMRSREHGWS